MIADRWDRDKADAIEAAAGDDAAARDLALQIHATRLIGADRALVQHGGGNTSVKVRQRDLFGRQIDVLYVKGSGRDLAEIDTAHMPGLRLDPLRALRTLKTLSDADMLNVMHSAMLESRAPNPSVEPLLHAFLPQRFINHTHATVMLALADLPDAAAVVAEIFGPRMAVVPFYKPGFDLGRAAAAVFAANPEAEGLLLLNHGHFAFGETAYDAYARIIAQTNAVIAWFQTQRGTWPVTTRSPNPDARAEACKVLPILRGVLGDRMAEHSGEQDALMPVLDLRTGDNLREFLARPDIRTLAARGVATPDHAIRVKNLPLLLDTKTLASGRAAIGAAVGEYADAYKAWFQQNAARLDTEPTMLSPIPGLVWLEGLGLVGVGRDARAAAIAADIGEENALAMTLAEDCGGYRPLDDAALFDMEYWALEQAKLGARPLSDMAGRVVLVTGGGGAIGLATATAFAERGANVFLVDLQEVALARALETLGPGHAGLALDITEAGAAARAMDAVTARFGGLDILVSNAGAAWSGEMLDLDESLLRKSFELNFFSHQAFATAAARLFLKQGRGGQILFNVSKQAVNPGKGFGAYGLPKATTFFLLRQLALELGPKGVRVNGINADRIRSGLLDDAFIKERARARGIDEGTYMAGNLIRREVEARHVAEAFVALATSERTTAHVMTVDGGNIEAALR